MSEVCAVVSQIREACPKSEEWFRKFGKRVRSLRNGFANSGSVLQPCAVVSEGSGSMLQPCAVVSEGSESVLQVCAMVSEGPESAPQGCDTLSAIRNQAKTKGDRRSKLLLKGDRFTLSGNKKKEWEWDNKRKECALI